MPLSQRVYITLCCMHRKTAFARKKLNVSPSSSTKATPSRFEKKRFSFHYSSTPIACLPFRSNTTLKRPISPHNLLRSRRLARQARGLVRRLTSDSPADGSRRRQFDSSGTITPPLSRDIITRSAVLVDTNISLTGLTSQTRSTTASTSGLCGCGEGLEKGLRLFGCQVLVEVVVDLDHGGVDAGAETFDFGEGEEAVFGCFAVVDAEVCFDGFQYAV